MQGKAIIGIIKIEASTAKKDLPQTSQRKFPFSILQTKTCNSENENINFTPFIIYNWLSQKEKDRNFISDVFLCKQAEIIFLL